MHNITQRAISTSIQRRKSVENVRIFRRWKTSIRCRFFNGLILPVEEALKNQTSKFQSWFNVESTSKFQRLSKYKYLLEHQNNCTMDDHIWWSRSFVRWLKMATNRNKRHNYFPRMQQLSLLEFSIFSVTCLQTFSCILISSCFENTTWNVEL